MPDTPTSKEAVILKLLSEGEGFQDWEAQHVSIDTVHRRVRIYTVAPFAFALRRCSSRRGMISTKLQGR